MPANTPRGYTYPLYADTQGFPAQIQDLAQDIDADVQGLYDTVNLALNEPSANVVKSIPQTIPSNVTTNITWDAELYDNASMVDLGVSNANVLIPVVGAYLITTWVQFNGYGVDPGVGALFIRGVNSVADSTSIVSKILHSDRDTELSMTTLNYFSTTTGHVHSQVRQNTASPLDIVRAGMTVTRVSP